jgi:hypothetical protein
MNKDHVPFADKGTSEKDAVANTGGTPKVLASRYDFIGLAVLKATVYSSAVEDIVSTRA